METTPTSSSSDSPYLRGRQSIAALFKTSDSAKAAMQALAEDGFVSDEIQQQEQEGSYLVTVFNPVHLAEAAAILQQHGGSLPDGDSATYEEGTESAHAAGEADTDDTGAASIPVDSGLSEPGSQHRVGGGTFTRGSGAGGSGSGTATGGSLFGSSR